MLLIPFGAGGERYALPAAEVHCVTAVPRLRPIPRAPAWVRGFFRYQGAILAAVDLSMLLCGSACVNRLSTRLILVGRRPEDAMSPALGLIAERVTATLSIEAEKVPQQGLRLPDTPWLGCVLGLEQALLQLVHWEPLWTDELAARLREVQPES
ncbi:MAG TPA: chemotaxis protein CheW [Methylococcus sp.]|nr:chemotaxis protein CheW [Methylococcus sp.]